MAQFLDRLQHVLVSSLFCMIDIQDVLKHIFSGRCLMSALFINCIFRKTRFESGFILLGFIGLKHLWIKKCNIMSIPSIELGVYRLVVSNVGK